MATARYSWGIDIGNRALKAIRLTHAGAGVKIDEYDVIEHEQILSNAGDNRDNLIQASLSTFVQKHNMKGSVVSVGVSGQSSFARFIKLPPVERKQIPNIVRFEAIQQIPFPLEDVEWSYQLFETPESPDVEVGIFAMRKELVAKHIQFFTDVDMKIAAVQMNPLAVYNAMQFDGRVKEPTMIIDMGAENTDLIIADNDTVWLRSISIGGNSFTEALVKAFKLNFQKAEELKRTAGTSKYTRQIFQAMRPIFGDLVGEIQRSMGFFASVRREMRIKRIIALGGTFKLPNLLRYLQQNLQLEVERMDSFRAGVPSDAKQAAGFNENMLSLAGAYGLALQGMGEGKIQSSLLPESIRRERMWKEKTKWFGVAAALMLAGTGIAYGSIYLAKTVGSSALKETNDRIYSKAKGLSDAWATIEGGGSDREMILKMKSLADYRLLWSNLIRDVRGALPKPQDAVVNGMAKWDADLVKTVARGDRRIVILSDFTSQYVSDMALALKDPDFRRYAGGSAAVGGGGGGFSGGFGPPPMGMGPPGLTPATPAASADAVKGFLITVRCTTPFKNGVDLVQNDFIKNLMSIQFAKDPDRRYMVARATIVTAMKLQNDQAKLTAIQNTYDVLRGKGVAAGSGMPGAGLGMGGPFGPGGMPGGFDPSMMGGPPGGIPMGPPPGFGGPGFRPGFTPVPGAGGATEQPKQQFHDPLTEEDVSEDWEFVVLFAVAVDPPASLIPAPPAATQPTETPAQ